jgi:hypothetical protein
MESTPPNEQIQHGVLESQRRELRFLNAPGILAASGILMEFCRPKFLNPRNKPGKCWPKLKVFKMESKWNLHLPMSRYNMAFWNPREESLGSSMCLEFWPLLEF